MPSPSRPDTSRRILTALVVFWSLVALALATATYLLHERALEREAHATKDNLAFLIDRWNAQMASFARVLSEDEDVQRLVARAAERHATGEDKNAPAMASLRSALAEEVRPLAEEIDRVGQRQVHFHLGEEVTSFLRMHAPARFGDSLASVRPLVQQAYLENRPLTGFEIGRVFSGLRAVQPIHAPGNPGQAVGTVEIGSGLAPMDNYLESSSGTHVSLLLPARTTEAHVWPEMRERERIQKLPGIPYHVDGPHLGFENGESLKGVLANHLPERLAERPITTTADQSRWLMGAVPIPISHVSDGARNERAFAVFMQNVDDSHAAFLGRLATGLIAIATVGIGSLLAALWLLRTERARQFANRTLIRRDRERIIGRAPMPALMTDCLGQALFHNRRFEEVFGAPDQPGGLDSGRLLTGLTAADREGLDRGHTIDVTRWLNTRGESGWFRVQLTCGESPLDASPTLWWFFLDVDAEHRRMQASQAQRDELDALLSVSPAVIYSVPTDDPTTVDYISPNIRTTFGFDRETVMATPNWWVDHVHPDDRQQALAEGDFLHWPNDRKYSRYRLLGPDGSASWVTDTARLLRDRDGKPQRLIGALLDSDHVLRLEIDLARQERLHRNLFEHAPAAMLLIEALPDGRFQLIANNPVHEAATGLIRKEVAGKELQAFLPPELADWVSENYRECIREQRSVRYSERLALPAGERVWDTTLTPVMNDQGEVELIVGMSLDQTPYAELVNEFSRTTRQLRRAQRIAHLGYLEWSVGTDRLSASGYLRQWFGPAAAPSTGSGTLHTEIERLLGKMPTADADKLRERVVSAMRTPLARGEARAIRHQGPMTTLTQGERYFAWDVQISRPRAQRLYMNITLQDISERHAADERMRRVDQRNSAILEAAGEGIFGLAPSGAFTFLNSAAAEMLGHNVTALAGREALFTLYDDDPDATRLAEASLNDGRARTRCEDRFTRADGSTFPVRLSVTPLQLHQGQDGIDGLVVVFTDISEEKRRTRQLQELASTDPLTGLPNRRTFLARVAEEFDRGNRYQGQASIGVFDLDHFKDVNDSLGHDAGDAVLAAVGDILRRELRTPDVTGRIGGEEFGLLLPDTGIDGACRTAERIRAAFAAASVDVGGRSLRFTASFGVAPLTAATSPEAALKQADEALYRAKASGRDRVWSGGGPENDREPGS